MEGLWAGGAAGGAGGDYPARPAVDIMVGERATPVSPAGVAVVTGAAVTNGALRAVRACAVFKLDVSQVH